MKNFWLRRKAIREDAMITYPNIYGFKTPEKHAFKMVDGDPKISEHAVKSKRMEFLSKLQPCGCSKSKTLTTRIGNNEKSLVK